MLDVAFATLTRKCPRRALRLFKAARLGADAMAADLQSGTFQNRFDREAGRKADKHRRGRKVLAPRGAIARTSDMF